MFTKQPVLLRLCQSFDRGIGQVIQPHGLFGIYQLLLSLLAFTFSENLSHEAIYYSLQREIDLRGVEHPWTRP
jgi:hypothetical protein